MCSRYHATGPCPLPFQSSLHPPISFHWNFNNSLVHAPVRQRHVFPLRFCMRSTHHAFFFLWENPVYVHSADKVVFCNFDWNSFVTHYEISKLHTLAIVEWDFRVFKDTALWIDWTFRLEGPLSGEVWRYLCLCCPTLIYHHIQWMCKWLFVHCDVVNCIILDQLATYTVLQPHNVFTIKDLSRLLLYILNTFGFISSLVYVCSPLKMADCHH